MKRSSDVTLNKTEKIFQFLNLIRLLSFILIFYLFYFFFKGERTVFYVVSTCFHEHFSVQQHDVSIQFSFCYHQILLVWILDSVKPWLCSVFLTAVAFQMFIFIYLFFSSRITVMSSVPSKLLDDNADSEIQTNSRQIRKNVGTANNFLC